MTAHDEASLQRTLEKAFGDPTSFHVPRGIIRHDHGTSHAWRVNISRDRANFIEYFYDGTSGSIENGLRRAILYRHEILSSFPITIDVKPGKVLDPDPQKRIRRILEKGDHQPYASWLATWYDKDLKRKEKQFSVLKYGEDEARRLALEEATRNHNPKPRTVALRDTHLTEVWRVFSRSDIERAAATNNRIYSKAVANRPEVAASDPFGYEGERRFSLHRSIERDRSLRNAKVAEFLNAHGRLLCEACGFSFRDRYPFLVSDVIEVHHIVPLSQLSSATLVTSADLLLLCSNCHTAVHQGDAVANLPKLLALLSGPTDA